MRISYLELRNYRRFKEVKLQFPDGIVGIVGPNGSGKTTLIEAVAWALFGNVEAVVRTSKEGLRRAGAAPSDPCSAVLEFELGGTGYRLEREMAGKSLTMKATLRAGDRVVAEGDAHVRRHVEKLIGMDQKSFFTSVFARQKELNALQNVQPGERKKAVLRMLRIDGIDGAIQRVRDGKRGVEDTIKWAEGTLLDDQGRDRETMVKAQLPALRQALEEAGALLKVAEAAETAAAKDLDEARAESKELRKDSEAYTAAARDLHAKRSRQAELAQRAEKLERNAKEAKEKLARLPELEAAEKSWLEVTASLESLEEERRKEERAAHLAKDLREDRALADGLSQELSEAERALSKADDIDSQRAALERSKKESETARSEVSKEFGELRGKVADRKEAASKDRAKLDEILRLGKEGRCPTCERVLEDAHDLLVAKLRKGIEEADGTVRGSEERMRALQGELDGLDRKDEALRKKAARLDDEAGKRKRLEATAEGLRRQLAQVDARVSAKSKEKADLGEVKFSKDAYESARSERARLKPLHDDFVRLKGVEDELSRTEAERAEVRERAERLALEVEALSRLTTDLEPKKARYDKVLKTVEEKMDILTRAKDEARSRAARRDSARSAAEAADKSLADMEKVRKSIEDERSKMDTLAALEEVMVSFRDHLIGKVAPTLAELTSHVLESTTGGRYAHVQLDDAYEMQVDDEGEMYPLGRFSGGESDLANLALRLAISRIIAERTGANPINFLILDEIFGSLDPERKKSVMLALSGLSAQFRQIFLITHIEDIKDLMGSVVRVNLLDDGTSSAALAS